MFNCLRRSKNVPLCSIVFVYDEYSFIWIRVCCYELVRLYRGNVLYYFSICHDYYPSMNWQKLIESRICMSMKFSILESSGFIFCKNILAFSCVSDWNSDVKSVNQWYNSHLFDPLHSLSKLYFHWIQVGLILSYRAGICVQMDLLTRSHRKTFGRQLKIKNQTMIK